FLLSFPLSRHADHRDRHSFPTRRSSDLYVANDDEQGFIDELLAGQPDAPAYFGRMKRQNRDGPAILGHRDPLPELDAAAVRKDIEDGSVVFVDTRDQHEIHRGTVPGSIN